MSIWKGQPNIKRNIPKKSFDDHIFKEENGCWIWKGAFSNGYGIYKRRRVHRISWEIYNSKIPKGLNVLHKCNNMKCVNPNHLYIGTQSDNMNDTRITNRIDNNLNGKTNKSILTWINKRKNSKKVKESLTKEGRILTLTEVSNEIVRNGLNVIVENKENKEEIKPKIKVELTKDDIQRIKKDENQKIKLYIEKGFTEEEARIDFSYGFPIIQLIKYQNGKCCCGEDLNIPPKGSPKETYQGLSHQVMKFEDNIGKFDIIGFDRGYKLYCAKCSGV